MLNEPKNLQSLTVTALTQRREFYSIGIDTELHYRCFILNYAILRKIERIDNRLIQYLVLWGRNAFLVPLLHVERNNIVRHIQMFVQVCVSA
jgi:hypothetical protein